MKTYIGIDNGVTGSIAIITENDVAFLPMPVKTEQSYTKARQNITRISFDTLRTLLRPFALNSKVIIERPMINPLRWKASMSAIRALEATLICVESIGFPYQYIDSKEWQRKMLPKGIKGGTELKKASVQIGCRLFPKYAEQIKKQKDADSLLIAEYARRTQL